MKGQYFPLNFLLKHAVRRWAKEYFIFSEINDRYWWRHDQERITGTPDDTLAWFYGSPTHVKIQVVQISDIFFNSCNEAYLWRSQT